MSTRVQVRVMAAAGAAGAVGLFIVAVPLVALDPEAVLWVLAFLSPFVAGGYAAWRRPESLAARRLLLLGAVATCWATAGIGLGHLQRDGWDAGWQWMANAVVLALDVAFPVTLLALLAVYPSGVYHRLAERTLVRVAAATVVLAPVLVLLSREAPFPYGIARWAEEFPVQVRGDSPLRVPALAPLEPVATAYLEGVLALMLAIGTAMLALRYRGLSDAQRTQLAWPMLGVVLLGVFSMLSVAFEVFELPSLIADLTTGLAFVSLPVLLAIGITDAHRLDPRLLIRRSLVYGGLSMLIAAAYVGLAAAVGVAAGALHVQLAVAVTIAATLLFQPLRRRVQRRAMSWAFGERLSREEMLRRFGGVLEHALDVDELAPAIASVMRQGLGVQWVRIEVDGSVVAVDGDDTAAAAAACAPLEHRRERLGTISCGPPPRGSFDASDRELLASLGRQTALSLVNARLAAQLSERLTEIRRQARELAASRTRIVHAEEVARRRIERDIHDGVQQELVALIARIALARNQLRRDPTVVDATLADLQSEARQALEDLQELARGIHPSVLSDRGIVEAIESRAARLPLGVTIECDRALRGARFPEAIEGAAYFLVCEGFANALKHSGGERVTVRMHETDGALDVTVADDGCGFEPEAIEGSGVRGLADRIEALGGTLVVSSRPGDGTVLTARLPTHDRAAA
jgi:signal transduction histidine kinase